MTAGVRVSVERHRRHTLYFLEYADAQRPVYLDTEIDMTAVKAHRAASARKYSIVTYVLHAVGQVMARHPEANAAMAPGWPGVLRRPRIARFEDVVAKVALDRMVAGRRVVLSALLPDLHQAGMDEIQDHLDRYRAADVADLPEFRGVRALGRVPAPVGRLAFRSALRRMRRRPAVLGTVSVSSLGHRPVDGFHSTGGTAVTVCAGRVVDRPVVRDGHIEVAPLMRLSLAFDHRVIDGAEASDLLGELKNMMEEFDAGDSGPVVRHTDQDHRAGRPVGAGTR
jgi:pyruvate/2-oxoglutarate dehydrogenase complex dihydrolipoamide acyltransferase (E2) component